MIDAQLISEFYNDDEFSILEITKMVKNQVPLVLEDLDNAVNKNDVKELNAKLHFHGPSFTYAGLRQVTNQMTTLEEKCTSNSTIEELTEEILQLKQLLAQSEIALTKYINDLEQRAA